MRTPIAITPEQISTIGQSDGRAFVFHPSWCDRNEFCSWISDELDYKIPLISKSYSIDRRYSERTYNVMEQFPQFYIIFLHDNVGSVIEVGEDWFVSGWRREALDSILEPYRGEKVGLATNILE